MENVSSVPSLSRAKLDHMGGLVDGEGYIGITMWRSSKSTFGFGVRPIFQIALGEPDSDYLRYLHAKLRLGQLWPNQKNGLAWIIKTKKEVRCILELVSPFVRFPTTRRKIELVLDFLTIMPNKRPLTKHEWKRELEIINSLRSMSKRKLNHTKHDVASELIKFRPEAQPVEAMVQEPAPAVILKVDGCEAS